MNWTLQPPIWLPQLHHKATYGRPSFITLILLPPAVEAYEGTGKNPWNSRFLRGVIMIFPEFDEAELYTLTVRVLSSNVVHLIICAFFGLCCYLPIMMGTKSFLEDTVLHHALINGGDFRDSSIASLALSLPLGIDLILDVINSAMYNRKIRIELSRTCLNSAEKLILLLGIN